MLNVIVVIFSLAIGLLIYKLYLEHKMLRDAKKYALSSLTCEIPPLLVLPLLYLLLLVFFGLCFIARTKLGHFV